MHINTNIPDPWDKHKKNPYEPWGPDIHRDSLKKWQEEKKPKLVTLEDLFPRLERWAIGFDPMFATLQALSAAKTVTYPPYNLTKKKDKFILELALAGYRKEDLEIFVEDRTLVIQTLPVEDLEEDKDIKDVESLHHGIAQRSFTQKFALSEYVVVKSAVMKDGILTVVLENELPEEKKPKVIDIK